MSKPKLWHCYNARSLRPLWAMEEMGIEFELEVLPFPPRFRQRSYLRVNPLGTVPYFIDGDASMTESTAICLYLVERYQCLDFAVAADHQEYANYLNWLFQSDATLTFPQTLVLRYAGLEPEDRRQPQVVKDYARWFLARLTNVDRQLEQHDFLCADRFTIADITVTYALHLGQLIGLDEHYSGEVKQYLERMQSRDGFKRAMEHGKDMNPFENFPPSHIELR